MKRIAGLLLSLALGSLVVACGNEQAAADQDMSKKQDEETSVGTAPVESVQAMPRRNVPPAEDGQPDQRQQDREIRRGLRQAILQLPAKSATIFTMRFLEGTPNREIADAMGMSQAAVGVAVHRARNQVKKEMASFVGGN